VLVTLNLTGFVNGFTGNTQIQFQILVNGLPAFTRTADINNRLLVTSVFVGAVDPVHPSTFNAFLKTLVSPAQLQNQLALEFLVQFKYANFTDVASALMNLDPKADALVLQEIGPSAL